jgi:hypothetical protein
MFFGNKMREILPTFTWTYGYTSCDFPFFNNQEAMTTACSSKVKLPKKGKKENIGLITEYIEGQNLEKFYSNEDVTYEKILSLFLVVFYSLKYANDRFGFVHWDLHKYNILMRKLEKDNQYMYLPDEKKYIWVGNTLPTIIDFGFSSIEKDNKIYGFLKFFNFGMNPFYSKSPLNDVYKLIENIIGLTHNRRVSRFKDNLPLNEENLILEMCDNILNKLLGLPEKISYKYISPNFDNFAIFPNSPDINIENFSSTTIDEIIQYVEVLTEKTNPKLIVKNKPSNVISCISNECLSEYDILDDIFVNENNNISLSQFIRGMKLSKEEYIIFNKVLKEYLDDIYDMIIYLKERFEEGTDYPLYAATVLRHCDLKLEKIINVTKDIKEFDEAYMKAIELKKELKNVLTQNLEDIRNPTPGKKYLHNKFFTYYNTNVDFQEEQLDKTLRSIEELLLNYDL